MERVRLECVYCKKTYSDTYDLFEHITTHEIRWEPKWEPKWEVQREERFMVVDVIPTLREERFQ